MAQTGYKCFRDGINAVPRDPMPTASPLDKLGDIPWVGLCVFSLASDIPRCLSLALPVVAQPSPEGSAGDRVAWHKGSSAMLPPDLACPVPSVGNGGLRVLKVFRE